MYVAAELIYNINGNWSGALRVGDFKLLRGHPNEAFRGTDGWSSHAPWAPAPPPAVSRRCEGFGCPCVARPCLFQLSVDPEERNDLAEKLPAKLNEMLQRYTELQRTEVTLEASGLCPQDLGPGINVGGWPDASSPDGCVANREAGYWQPWMD